MDKRCHRTHRNRISESTEQRGPRLSTLHSHEIDSLANAEKYPDNWKERHWGEYRLERGTQDTHFRNMYGTGEGHHAQFRVVLGVAGMIDT